ncbi:MAG TPA: head decoration protein, partial [Burkholderiales bacterium]|nr:head decoration protein [Burkholderiales bacterium]
MSLTEKAHAWGFLLSEQDNGNLSRDNGTLISGQNLGAGTVLGKITLGTATAAAKAGGNSGNGTITMDGSTPVLAFADVGVYTVRCITAAANGGVFEVKNPTGRSLGTVTISGGAGGTGSFADQVKFVLTDGTGDFAVGD